MEVTEDRILGGTVSIRQPKDEFRVAIDTVFLAAAVPARAGQRVFEPGAGIGAAALCLARRVSGLRIEGIEKQQALVALANDNVRANGLAGSITVMAGDISAPLPMRIAPPFDHVIMNPPFLPESRGHAPPDAARAAASVEDAAGLKPWADLAHRLLGGKATLTLVHRADRLSDILTALGDRFGDVAVYPLWPREGVAARRVLVRARKGVASPLQILPGLALHDDDGHYTPAAAAVLNGGALDF